VIRRCAHRKRIGITAANAEGIARQKVPFCVPRSAIQVGSRTNERATLAEINRASTPNEDSRAEFFPANVVHHTREVALDLLVCLA
jgi:hypothetical protein